MYRKNVAGQHVCFQLLLTATGAVATGLTPSVRRCIDGTFAAGGGTVTEDGTTGSYKYAMSQADTNGNNISFIFTGTGAMPVCVNIVTTAADPTDTVRFGLTAMPNVASGNAGALIVSGTGTAALSVSSGLVTLAGVTHTGAVIPTVSAVTGLTASNLDATISSRMATYTQPTGFLAATFPTGTIANTTNITAGTLTTVTTATNLTNNNDKTGYGLTAPQHNLIADAILDRDMSTGSDSGSSTVRTMRQALRFLRNKFAIVAGTLTVYKEDDTTASWTAAITTTAGNPVSSSDPAGP
jgi:hypothetical protein